MSDIQSTADASRGWYVISQVKSDRVVYFTDDPDYRPQMEGDWYFVSHFVGVVPQEMTLRNCWGWRFDGSRFMHANDPEPRSVEQSLLETNRQALGALLASRVDALRKQWAPSCVMGDSVRAQKLDEAQRYLAGATAPRAGEPSFALLEAVAAARAITLPEAAELIVRRAADARAALVASEVAREQFALDIERATTNEQLTTLRHRLLASLQPGNAPQLPPPRMAMAPREWDVALGDPERHHEAGSLRSQLREAINARRRRVHDGYLDNEILMKHKAKLAQTLLSNEGVRAEGQDYTLLANFAEPRHLSLEEAARLSLGAVTEAEGILRATERDKDRLLARIEAARTLREFHRLRLDIDAMAGRGN